jgi:hypothetical protein
MSLVFNVVVVALSNLPLTFDVKGGGTACLWSNKSGSLLDGACNCHKGKSVTARKDPLMGEDI